MPIQTLLRFIVRGPTISKLQAQTLFASFYCLRLIVIVYKLVIYVSMNSHHGKSVYQGSLLEDPQYASYRHKYHLQFFYCLRLFVVVYKLVTSVSINFYHGK